MANPHNPYPSAQKMGALAGYPTVQVATVYTAAATVSSINPAKPLIGVSGDTGYSISLAVTPKPGDGFRYFIHSDHTAGTHKITPNTAYCTVTELDGTTALTTSLDFGTTAVPGTFVDFYCKTPGNWAIVGFGTGCLPQTLPTGVTQT